MKFVAAFHYCDLKLPALLLLEAKTAARGAGDLTAGSTAAFGTAYFSYCSGAAEPAASAQPPLSRVASMRAACANHCLTPVVAALLLSLSLPRSALCGRGSEVFAAASHTTDSASRQLRAAQDHSGDSSWGIATNPTIAGSGLGVKGGKADSSENFRLRRSCGTGVRPVRASSPALPSSSQQYSLGHCHKAHPFMLFQEVGRYRKLSLRIQQKHFKATMVASRMQANDR